MSDLLDEMKYDWYAVLGCNSESTKSFIEKSARKLFLKYHPDKTNDPKAPEMFLRVQRAKEILLDDTKRKAIDEAKVLVTKRQDYDNERSKNMDVRRKRMRDDLEAKLDLGKKNLGSLGKNTSCKIGEDRHKDQSANIERLRREGASLREASMRDAESKEAKRVYDILKEKKAQEKKVELDGGVCQIKIKWKRSRQSHSDESLALLFKVFGNVEAVTMVGEKGNSATILFAEEISATSAVANYATSTEYRVTVPFKDAIDNKKRAAIFTHVYNNGSNTSAQPYRGAEIFSTSAKDISQESELMRQMARAVEREEIIRTLNHEGPSNLSTSTYHSSSSMKQSNDSSHRTSDFPIGDISGPSGVRTGVLAEEIISKCTETVTIPSLANKEADILKRMMEAAMLRRKVNIDKNNDVESISNITVEVESTCV